MPVIIASSLSKTYSPKSRHAVRALDNVSLQVQAGEIFGLLGPNGSGKTTFIKLLLGIAFPTSGSGTVLGEPLGSTDVKARIGYLPENHRYPPYLNGEQILRFFGKLTGLESRLLDRRIDEVLKQVGMEQWRKVKFRKYSKGMMQRIGLAQALLNQPEVIFLDEPTDGVDPLGRKEIRELIKHLRDRGTTVFINSHLLSEVEMISDRVAILHKGKLIREGTVESLTKDGDQWEITAHGDVHSVQMDLEARSIHFHVEKERITIIVPDLQEANHVSDLLRSRGLLIESMQQKKHSLEDFFIKVIQDEDR
ncbi:MAG: ABC transporter ATP-binding protein [Chlorobi bacterium]|nr:ABC transporter ATP-binding protein [Chlorobiota bacterium]